MLRKDKFKNWNIYCGDLGRFAEFLLKISMTMHNNHIKRPLPKLRGLLLPFSVYPPASEASRGVY